MIVNCEENRNRVILRNIPKEKDLFSIKIPIEYIDFKCGRILFAEFKKHLQNCSNIKVVINESDEIFKEKEGRAMELKEEIQRRCDNKLEIPVELLNEYNNLI